MKQNLDQIAQLVLEKGLEPVSAFRLIIAAQSSLRNIDDVDELTSKIFRLHQLLSEQKVDAPDRTELKNEILGRIQTTESATKSIVHYLGGLKSLVKEL